MYKFKRWILGSSPYPEYIMRRIYYSNKKFITLKNIKNKNIKPVVVKKNLFEMIINQIKSLNIENGDILIVHSSMDELAKTGATPKQIIDFLLELVGDQGTLVFPAFPVYKSVSSPDGSDEILIYNTKRSLCWTGMLPNIFLRYPGVIRSECPVNPLAAKGRHAEEMMRYNLDCDLAHGKNSAWEYCMDHHAKVLFLGIDSSHSATIVHVSEDLMDTEWPIMEWYETKQFRIVNETETKDVLMRIRKPYWSRFITANYRTTITTKLGLIERYEVDGMSIEYIRDSKRFLEFLIDQARHGEVYYKIPKKYRRKE